MENIWDYIPAVNIATLALLLVLFARVWQRENNPWTRCYCMDCRVRRGES